jgi:3-oxoacyl-[acyl-carrier-protein] synthase-3
MSFNFQNIEYKLGEVEIPVKDICLKTNQNYERLIKRSGFEFVHRSTLSEEEFFTKFLKTSLRIIPDDFVIFVNQSMSETIPGAIPILFKEIENINVVGTLEISDGCTGFTRALILANQILSSDTISRVHIVCAEKYSKYYDDTDLSVSPIFSDAISLTTISKGGPYKILGHAFKNFFDKSQCISVSESKSGDEKIVMAGAEVLTWVIREIPKVVEELLSTNNMSVRDIESWLFHQGSKIVVETICEQLQISSEKQFQADKTGNTVSSSIPIMISQFTKESTGNYFAGGNLVVLSFGVGLSVAATLIEVKL